jgi:hypothetical protein
MQLYVIIIALSNSFEQSFIWETSHLASQEIPTFYGK